jgi:hypothetical protein
MKHIDAGQTVRAKMYDVTDINALSYFPPKAFQKETRLYSHLPDNTADFEGHPLAFPLCQMGNLFMSSLVASVNLSLWSTA